MGLEGEVAGIKEFNYRVWQILFERFSAGRQEKGIFIAPDSQEGGLIFPEIFMKRGIQGDVRSVILEKVQLQLFDVLAVEQELVQGIGFRGYQALIRHPGEI